VWSTTQEAEIVYGLHLPFHHYEPHAQTVKDVGSLQQKSYSIVTGIISMSVVVNCCVTDMAANNNLLSKDIRNLKKLQLVAGHIISATVKACTTVCSAKLQIKH